MGCLGVLFAITSESAGSLLAATSDDEVMALVKAIEEQWDEEHLAEVDKSWDAMHRALANGTLDMVDTGNPLGRAILNGRQLHQGDDYIVSLVLAEQVP